MQTLPVSASGDDGVFDADVRLLLGEPGRQVFGAVKITELGALGGSVLHTQFKDYISNGKRNRCLVVNSITEYR